jgi:hypothetical protein
VSVFKISQKDNLFTCCVDAIVELSPILQITRHTI